MITHLTTTAGNDEFYPTPKNIAKKMLANIDWAQIRTILEPSAGKGNLVEFALRERYKHTGYGKREIDVDCIEIDPHLRQILKYNFSDDGRKEIYEKLRSLDREARSSLSMAQKTKLESLKRETDIFDSAVTRIIHDDFLTYNGIKRYDLILMNPPFSNGDKHLIKAIEMQKDGGEIVCLLNAETIRNPYTNSRQLLAGLLKKHNAKILYVRDGFTGKAGAERAAEVEVAIIKIRVPREQERESEFWERMKKAADFESKPQDESCEITLTGFFENIIAMYNVEVAASIKLIEEYNALKPHISREFSKEGSSRSNTAILTLTVGTDGNCLQVCDINKYLKVVRLKYWRALFSNSQFTGKLTSNLQAKYNEIVRDMADYDFTMFNIQTVLAEMNSEMIQGVKDTILSIFEKLSTEHAHFPECQNNIHYYNGWKTNKAHKVNHKVIIPTWGMFSTYSYDKGGFDVSTAYSVLSDIEKVFNYLDGGLTAEVDLHKVLMAAKNGGYKQNIDCKYFTVSLFKKGTTHIKFKNQALVDKLNIYAARNLKWLPPVYGKKQYADMDLEERGVIDEFQGEAEYAKVMAAPSFYLFETDNAMLEIEQKTEIT